MRERNLAPEHWGRIVELVQTAFRDGILPSECALQMDVILLKGNSRYIGIELDKVL